MCTDYELLIRYNKDGSQGAYARYQDETSLGVMAGPAVPLYFGSEEFQRLVLRACERCSDDSLSTIKNGIDQIMASRIAPGAVE